MFHCHVWFLEGKQGSHTSLQHLNTFQAGLSPKILQLGKQTCLAGNYNFIQFLSTVHWVNHLHVQSVHVHPSMWKYRQILTSGVKPKTLTFVVSIPIFPVYVSHVAGLNDCFFFVKHISTSPSVSIGNPTLYPLVICWYWKWLCIYSGFSHQKWWVFP